MVPAARAAAHRGVKFNAPDERTGFGLVNYAWAVGQARLDADARTAMRCRVAFDASHRGVQLARPSTATPVWIPYCLSPEDSDARSARELYSRRGSPAAATGPFSGTQVGSVLE